MAGAVVAVRVCVGLGVGVTGGGVMWLGGVGEMGACGSDGSFCPCTSVRRGEAVGGGGGGVGGVWGGGGRGGVGGGGGLCFVGGENRGGRASTHHCAQDEAQRGESDWGGQVAPQIDGHVHELARVREARARGRGLCWY